MRICPAAQGKAVEGGQSDAQRVVLALQLCAGLAACKIMSDIATKTLEGAEALTCYRQPQSIHLHTLLTGSPHYNIRCATSDAGVGADSEADLEAEAEPAARGKKGQ